MSELNKRAEQIRQVMYDYADDNESDEKIITEDLFSVVALGIAKLPASNHIINNEVESKALNLQRVVPSTFEKNRAKEAIRKWFLDKTGDEINPLYLDELVAKITNPD